MRALLDVNILIALFTPNHVHALRAHSWWRENETPGWATCPVTQNGFVRITSQALFPYSSTTAAALAKLKDAMVRTRHEFWADSISIADESIFDPAFLLGHRQVTDTYLLALAMKNDGCLVTFDRSIQLASVRGAKPGNIVIV
jgi:uncharacterized protein